MSETVKNNQDTKYILAAHSRYGSEFRELRQFAKGQYIYYEKLDKWGIKNENRF